jgi:hypothetical protein
MRECGGACANIFLAIGVLEIFNIGWLPRILNTIPFRLRENCMATLLDCIEILRSSRRLFIRALIVDRMPDQLKIPYALWARKAIAELIADQIGIEMPM